MNLKKRFYKLEVLGLMIEVELGKIYSNYLNSDRDFPYNEVNILLDRYELMYEKAYRMKNVSLNEMVLKISKKKREEYMELEVLSRKEILTLVSREFISSIVNSWERYLPSDEKSTREIGDKLAPVVRNLEVRDLFKIYKEIRERLLSLDEIDDKALFCLQKMFSSFIIGNLSNEELARYRNTFLCGEDIYKCVMFEEDILEVDSSKKRIR